MSSEKGSGHLGLHLWLCCSHSNTGLIPPPAPPAPSHPALSRWSSSLRTPGAPLEEESRGRLHKGHRVLSRPGRWSPSSFGAFLGRGRSGDDLWESSLWVKARGLGFISALLRALHMTSARLFHCSSGCSENEQMALFHHPLSPLGHSPRVLLWQLPLTVLGVHEESPNTP